MLETETVLDRRRLRRSLSFWRAAGIAGLALAIGAMALGGDKFQAFTGQKQIARISLEGAITENRDQLKMLKEIAEDDKVAGVLMFVNSPGGTTAGGEALYEALRNISKKKPVVAQFGTVAASAAYIAGLATDHIVARGNTITGSVGVILEWPEVHELLGRFGVKMNEIKSGPLKAEPSPFRPLDDKGRQVAEGMINDGFKWFLDLVETRRSIKASEVAGLVEGRIFSGREALDKKLIDEIGGEEEAVNWLKDIKKIDKAAKVVDWKPESSSSWGLRSMVPGFAGRVLGPEAGHVAGLLLNDPMATNGSLDGLLSVWHPSDK